MSSVIRLLLSPLSYIYMLAYLLRWTFYYFGVFKKVKVPVPVVSVGNITMGGSGKTPFMMYLLEKMSASGVKAAVVTRSYKGSVRKSTIVPHPEGGDFNPLRLGDEACLIKRTFPGSLVVTGPKKSDSALAASELQPDIILVDDGFQHWKLHRDLDIVLLDVTEKNEDWSILPMGRAREPFAAMGRSSVIVLTKTNLVSMDRVDSIHRRLRSRIAPELPLVCEAEHVLAGFRKIGGSSALSVDVLRGKKLALLSGIAKPDGFEELLRQAGLGPVALHLKMKDHDAPSETEIKNFLQECQRLGCESILMTQKDAVKWNYESSDIKCFEALLSVRVSTNEEQLWKKISELYP
jgi:tetraacyldisaccharide 4'-kinase